LLKKILTSSLWLLIGSSIGRLAIFITNIVAARVLSQETFGQFMMIRSTISMIEGIISGSLGSPMIKGVAEVAYSNKKKLSTVISSIFIVNISMAIILIIILILLTPLLVEHFFINETKLIVGFYIGSILLLTTTLATMMQNILTGFEEYKKLAYSGFISSLISLPIMLVLIYQFDFFGALLGITIYFAIDFLIKFIQFKKIYTNNLYTIPLQKIWEESKKILIFSSPILGTVIINGFMFWYARIFIINESDNFSELALFDAAYQWQSIIMLITGSTTSVILPMLTKSIINTEEVKKIFYINLVVNFLIAFSIAVIFIIFSKNIMLVYGESYSNGSEVLIILALNSIFFSLAAVYNRFFIAKSMPIVILISVIFSSVAMEISLYSDYFDGAKKLAISFLLFYLVNTLFFATVKLYKKV